MGEEDKTWNAVIRQALIAGYLSKDVENYGLLKVTDEGKKFLKHPKSFKITEDNDFEEMEEEVPARGGGSCAVDPALYSMLKDLRKKTQNWKFLLMCFSRIRLWKQWQQYILLRWKNCRIFRV